MAVKIRLTRMGAKGHPTYRIVATDSHTKVSGEYLELIGHYYPCDVTNTSINKDLALKWLNNGAIPSDTVKNIFSKEGIMKEYHDSKVKKEK